MIAESEKFEAFVVGAVKIKDQSSKKVAKDHQNSKKNAKKDHEDSLFEKDSIEYVFLSHKEEKSIECLAIVVNGDY